MRRWLLALAAFAIVAVLGLALAARNLGAYLDANRDAIAEQAARALGREVAFGEVGIRLRGGLAVWVADLRIGDDPAFSGEPFLAAEALEVRVALLPALRGRIEVERALLRSPTITVIQTATGLSTSSLGRPAPPEGAPAAPADSSTPDPLVIALVDLEDATLRHVDRRTRPPIETVATDVDFRASGLAPGAPIAFEMEAAVLGATRQNLRASGTVSPPATSEPAVDLALVLDPLDLERALASAPLAGRAPSALAGSGAARVELRAKGSAADLGIEMEVDARDAELRLGEGFTKPRGGALSLALSARRRGDALEITAGEIATEEMRLALRGAVEELANPRLRFHGSSASGSLRGMAYRDLAVDVRAGEAGVEIPRLALAACEGTFDASGSALRRGADGLALEGRLAVEGVALESLLAAWAPSAAGRARGRVNAHLALRGTGTRLDAIAPSLAGGGDVEVLDGVLTGFNPAGEALRALVGVPVLSGRKLEKLFESNPRVFGAEDTAFERIETRIEVADGEIHARDARLLTREFSVLGGGRYAPRDGIDGDAVMAFSPELSQEIVDADKKLRFLRSPEGRVEFPVVISGPPGDLSVHPDLVHIASSVSREALGGVALRVLVGKRRDPEPGDGAIPEPEGAAETPPASIEDAGRDLLRRGLGGLLGAPREE